MPGVLVSIKGAVLFAPNHCVEVTRKGAAWPADELAAMVRLAHSHMHDDILVDACCGGEGPLADLPTFELDYDDYLALKKRHAGYRSALTGGGAR